MPFPDIHSGLATKAHMYICYSPGKEKKLLKVQTMKPMHVANMPCKNYIIEKADGNRNPFERKSIIDLDKHFHLSNIVIDNSLLARRNICEDIFTMISKQTNELRLCPPHVFSHEDLLKLNSKLKIIS
jgi:hypothetical protein